MSMRADARSWSRGGSTSIKLPQLGNGSSAPPSTFRSASSVSNTESSLEKWQKLQRIDTSGSFTPRERTRFIGELMGICRAFEQENQRLQADNANLRGKLHHNETQRDELTRALHEQQAMTRTYELFSFVPPSLSEENLMESIEELDTDIRSNELVTDIPHQLEMPVLGTEANGRVWQLLELKFQRLETLLVVLKKRILKFEENEHLASVVREYGDLPSLMKDISRLKEENRTLRAREERFQADPLLDRYLAPNSDVPYLRVLCMALQNELTGHRSLLDKYNVLRNPMLQMLVVPPAPVPDVATLPLLDEWLQDETLTNDFSKELEEWRETSGGELPHQLDHLEKSQLIQRVSALETEKLLLEDQVRRLEAERRIRADVTVMREYCDKELTHPLKCLTKKQFQDLNEKLVEEIKVLQDKLSAAQNTVTMQSKAVASVSEEKRLHMEENLIVSRRVLQLLSQNKALYNRLQKAQTMCTSLYTANLSTINALLEGKVGKGSLPASADRLHRDLLRTYFRFDQAALRIQSWWRGIRVRATLKERLTLKVLLTYKRPLSPFAMDDEDGDNDSPLALGSEGDFLPVLKTLAKIVLTAGPDSAELVSMPSVLRIASEEVQRTLRPKIEQDLNEWREYMEERFSSLNTTMATVLRPPERKDAATLFRGSVVEVETQTEDDVLDNSKKKKKETAVKERPGSSRSQKKKAGK